MAAQVLKGKKGRFLKDHTILSQACLPSMKPLGMALGVRISYLEVEQEQRVIVKSTVALEKLFW